MKKRLLSFVAFLMISIVFTTMFSLSATASTLGTKYPVVNAVYNSSDAKVTYHTDNYTIKNGKTIKFEAIFSDDSIINKKMPVRNSNNKVISKSEILNQVRFDIHVYDKNGKCVNYKYGICNGGKFKVVSNIKNIKQGEYLVKVVGYISNYKTMTFRAGDHANLAMRLKYTIK